MDPWNTSARLFKLLGHPARLAILGVLREGEACVCHLEAVLGFRQAYISQHLMALREAGVVRDRREGANVFYRLGQPAVLEVVEAGLRLQGDKPPLAPRAAVPDCPCPKCLAGAEPEASSR